MTMTPRPIPELPFEKLESPARPGSTETANTRPVRLDLDAIGKDRENAPAIAWSALHLAAHAGDVDRVRELLATGSDPSERAVPADGCVGATALHCAVASQSAAVVEALLRAGADPEARDEAGYTALLLASEIGDLATVRVLLKAGADPSRELADLSPLGAARRGGHHQVAALLRQVERRRSLR